jgi:penicillin-binding protein 2
MSFSVNVPAPLDRSTVLRLAFLAALSVLLLGALLARLWFLQVLAGDRFAELADSNRLRTVVSQAPRGHILASDGSELVEPCGARADRGPSGARRRCGTPRDEEAARTVRRSRCCSGRRGDAAATHRRRPYSPFRPVPVAVDVDPRIVLTVRQNQELFVGHQRRDDPRPRLPGGRPRRAPRRLPRPDQPRRAREERYADYRGGDLIGRGGLEQSYEADLRGRGGQEVFVVNRRGSVIDVQSRRDPQPGLDLVTWLDLDVQREVEAALAEGIVASRSILRPTDASALDRRLRDRHGRAHRRHRRDGLLPDLRPRRVRRRGQHRLLGFVNDPAQGQPLNNRPIAGQYPPGSVYKIVSGAAMLEAGLVGPTTRVGCPGATRSPTSPSATGTLRTRGDGPRDRAQAVLRHLLLRPRLPPVAGGAARRRRPTRSCSASRASSGSGERARHRPAGGAGRRRPRPRVARGVLAALPRRVLRAGVTRGAGLVRQELLLDLCRFGGVWRGGDAINMSIGQGDVLTTPLQMAAAYQAVANDGVLLRPTVGRELREDDGTLVRTIEPEVVSELDLTEAELGASSAGLERTVMEPGGTAYGAFLGFPFAEVPVAGKTGTAERKPRVPYAWFAAYAPADDPRYVVVVSVEEGGGGSQTAAPIARRILEHALRRPTADAPDFVAGPEILD